MLQKAGLSVEADPENDVQATQQAYPASAGGSSQAGAARVPRTGVIHDRELERGNKNPATLAVARKMVCYMLAVERRQKDFVLAEKFNKTAAA